MFRQYQVISQEINEVKIKVINYYNKNKKSTGCLETGEALMGVTKTLMASNDTLFNFEDTLGDRDDAFSPRTPSAPSSQLDQHATISRSSSSSIYECRTPTGGGGGGGSTTTTVTSAIFSAEESVMRSVIDFYDDKSRCAPDAAAAAASVGDDFGDVNTTFCMPTTSSGIDLLSPDQQKTFSEDICSAEYSAAMDTSFTATTTTTTTSPDEKTCISVPPPFGFGGRNAMSGGGCAAEEKRLSQMSEPEWGSSSMLLDMSLEDIPSLNDANDDDGDDEQAAIAIEEIHNDDEIKQTDLEFLTAVTAFGYQTKELQRNDDEENLNPNEGAAQSRVEKPFVSFVIFFAKIKIRVIVFFFFIRLIFDLLDHLRMS